MSLKTGRLSNKEKREIIELSLKMTPEQIAEHFNRTEESIRAFMEDHAPRIKNVDADVELLAVLHNKVYWKAVKDQFTEFEVRSFEHHWVEMLKQFNHDIEFSEEMQLVDLLRLRLLTDRNLYERQKARKDLEFMQSRLDDFIKENDYPPYDDPQLNAEYQILHSQVKACEVAYTSRTDEYTKLLHQQQTYFDELKATRKHRIEILKNIKKDFVGLIKSLMDEKVREKEGRELAIMNLAAEKEYKKLSEYHIYSDGEGDRPLLNEDTVILDEEK